MKVWKNTSTLDGYDDGLVLNEGAVYLYHLNDNSWVNNSIISPRDSQLNAHFGLSVDMSENNIIVGSRLDDDQGKDAGAAYIYNSVFVSVRSVVKYSFENSGFNLSLL